MKKTVINFELEGARIKMSAGTEQIQVPQTNDALTAENLKAIIYIVEKFLKNSKYELRINGNKINQIDDFLKAVKQHVNNRD